MGELIGDNTKYLEYLRKNDINATGPSQEDEKEVITAGFKNDYIRTIRLVYRLALVNQTTKTATETEIVDYYDEIFDVTKVYTEGGGSVNWGTTSKCGEVIIPSGYKAIYIDANATLGNNSKQYIYIELETNLHENSTALNRILEKIDEGYTTFNFAELNGYRTEEGILDIDSIPGTLTKDGKGRFENGEYEDDESKSPAMIFKNPTNAQRTISGIFFEDETKNQEIKAYSGEERNGDSTYSSGDNVVIGGIVRLIEIDDSGNEITSGNEREGGIKGERGAIITDENGYYIFNEVVAGHYKLQFEYGGTEKTVLATVSGGPNKKSYNGQDFENTKYTSLGDNEYWYVKSKENKGSVARDISDRRAKVIEYSKTLTNHKAEVFNSWKDRNPIEEFIEELRENTNMYARTEKMTLEVEYYQNYPEKDVENTHMKNEGDFKYEIKNINFGIVERERAEIQITKKVSYISIVDSTGKEITGGTEAQMKAGEIKYIKMVPNSETQGFVGMEIDKELLSGATLIITYKITVTNTSETSAENPNTIKQIEVVDYVSNNLNYDENYEKNSENEWRTVTLDKVSEYINNKSLGSVDISNKIDLSAYQTILMATFNELKPNESKTKYLTLKKNLSAEEDSDFNYENQVEIVQSYNEKGRGDYSSIYGNLDPTTYTSRQGNLQWDYVATENANEYKLRQMPTATELEEGTNPSNAIRVAEKDSGNAEEVTITPPTGATGLVLQTKHYILALTSLITLVGSIILIKKYKELK